MDWHRFASSSSLVFGMVGSLYLSTDLFGRRQGVLRRLSVALVLALMGGMAMGIPFIYGLYGLLAGARFAQDRTLLAVYVGAIGVSGLVNWFFGDHISSADTLSTAGVLETLSWLIGQSVLYLAYAVALGYLLARSLPPLTVVVLVAAVLIAGACVVRLSVVVSDLTARAENSALGGIGAFLTFLAFAIQFGLALSA